MACAEAWLLELLYAVMKGSGAPSGQDAEAWLRALASGAEVDRIGRPAMCSRMTRLCEEAEKMDQNLPALLSQTGLQNGERLFQILKDMTENAFPTLWGILKQKLKKGFLHELEAFKALNVGQSFLPLEADWQNLVGVPSSAEMWESMQPMAKILNALGELPDLQAEYLSSELRRKACVFNHRCQSLDLRPDYCAPNKQQEAFTRILKDADSAVVSLTEYKACGLISDQQKESARLWFQEVMVKQIFLMLGHMQVGLDDAHSSIPQEYNKYFAPDTRNVQQIKTVLFNRKTHEAVSMYSDDFASAAKSLLDSIKKWQPFDIVDPTNLAKVKKFEDLSHAIRVYCNSADFISRPSCQNAELEPIFFCIRGTCLHGLNLILHKMPPKSAREKAAMARENLVPS